MSRFLDERLRGLQPYVAGEQPRGKAFIKLNTNESPYFPSRYSLDRIDGEALKNVRLYSDPENRELRSVIAAYYGVKPENVLCTNGSDEALAFCFAAFCGRGAVFPDVTYGFYKVLAGLYGVPYTEVPLLGDFTVDVHPYLDCGRTVFLANPNAQTGIYLGQSELGRIVASDRGRVVVVDEAYADFASGSALSLLGGYDNVAVVRTFSKSRSLAGARVGYVIAGEGLIEDLDRVRNSFNPYNVNRISAALACEAMRDDGYFKECVARIIASRVKLSAELFRLGFEVLPSRANFLLARHPKMGGGELYEKLKEQGVLVRHFGGRIEDFVRITVGSKRDCAALIEIIEDILR